MYELITGHPPYEAPQIGALCQKILSDPLPPLRVRRADAPPGLEAVLCKALEKRPRDRYESVGTFAVALAAFGSRGAVAEAERTAKMLEHAAAELSSPVEGANLRLKPAAARSDMMVTRKRVELEPAAQGRSITSHSWHRMLSTAPDRRSRIAAIGGVATLAALAALAVAFLSAPDPSASTPAPAALDSERPAFEPPADAATAPSAPASSTEVVVVASASAPAKAAPAKKPPPTRRRTPPPKPPPPKPDPDLFDHRW